MARMGRRAFHTVCALRVCVCACVQHSRCVVAALGCRDDYTAAVVRGRALYPSPDYIYMQYTHTYNTLDDRADMQYMPSIFLVSCFFLRLFFFYFIW